MKKKILLDDFINPQLISETATLRSWIQLQKSMILQGPLNTFPLPSFLHSSGHIIIDGGINFFAHLPSHSLILGDGDSLAPSRTTAGFHYIFPVAKHFTDLEAALMMLPANIEELALIGLMGGRWDQTCLLIRICEHLIQTHTSLKSIYLLDQGMMLTKNNFHISGNGTFSLLSTQPQRVEISGAAHYCGTFELDPYSGEGMSNQATGKIKIHGLVFPIWVFFPVEFWSTLQFFDL